MNITLHERLPKPPSWAQLFEDSAAGDYFSSRAWYQNFLATVVAGDGEAVFYAAEDELGQPAAVLPMWRRKPSGLLRLSRLESLSNYYSCLYQPLLCADRTRAARGLDAIIAHLVKVKSTWSVIDLRPMPDDAWYLQNILDGFSSRGFAPTKYFAFGNWYLESVDLSFERYFSTRRKKMRSTVRSKTNQLSERYKLEFRIVENSAMVDEAFDAYNRVYATSWKQPEPYTDFIPGFMRALASDNQLRLGLFLLDNRPVAAQLWFVAHGVAYIFKLSYDPDFSEYSVGTLMTMKLMEHVLDTDHVTAVDFLSGDDDYKQQWMSHRRERVGIEIVNGRSIRGFLINARTMAGRTLRRLKARTQ